MFAWKRILELTVTRSLRLLKDVSIDINGVVLACPITVNYTASLVTQTIHTSSRRCRVKAIQGRVRVAGSGGACTISLYKVPSGTAVGSGTVLHSGSYNLVGTVDTNQLLTLSTTASDLVLAAGDSIGYALTGTATSAVGSVTVELEPA